MTALRKVQPASPKASGSSEGSQVPELPEFIDRLYRKVQHAAPGKRKWAEEAIDELSQMLDLSERILTDAASGRGLAILRAQSSEEYLPTLRSLDPLAPAFARGARAKQELIEKSGGVLTTDQVAELLEVTPQAVIKKHNSGKLLALTFGRRGFRYPAWQFDQQRGTVINGLDHVLSALTGRDAWMQNMFFLNPNARLRDRRPVDVLREGKFELVIEAARTFLEQGAA